MADGIHAAFGVLHVHGGIDINAGVEQLADVLVTLGMAGTGDIGVGQFIHHGQLGTAGQQGVQVHFLQRHPPVFHFAARQDGQPGQQALGFLAPVSFDVADDDLHALALGALGGAEHGVSLADLVAASLF